MAEGFQAKIERSYTMEGQRVLVIGRDYLGDIEAGDWVEVEVRPSGRSAGRVTSVAWGSAFHADDPPLTLVVEALSGDPLDAARVWGLAAPPRG